MVAHSSRLVAGTAIAVAMAGACASPRPKIDVGFQGSHFPQRKASTEQMEIYRDGVPPAPYEDIGFVTVRCPANARLTTYSSNVRGGCTYEQALLEASQRVIGEGADGLRAITSGAAANGNVVNLTATVFRYTDASGPRRARPAKAAGATVEERLRHLQDLRDQGLITPEDFDRRKAEILKDI